jgi:hypothetical protein
MATQDFRVQISGGTVSLDDWRLAMSADDRELPELSEAQKEAALKIGIDEPEYARGVLAESIGEKREQERGRQFGALLSEILDRAHKGWHLESLLRKGVDAVWVVRLEASGAAREVKIPLELVDDTVDSKGSFGKTRLENLIATQLEHPATRMAS